MTLAELKAQAYNTFEYKCLSHDNCHTVTYYVATIMSYGSDKSHRLGHTHHSSDDSIWFDNTPGCGSKRWGSPHSFQPVNGRPTCGRC